MKGKTTEVSQTPFLDAIEEHKTDMASAIVHEIIPDKQNGRLSFQSQKGVEVAAIDGLSADDLKVL